LARCITSAKFRIDSPAPQRPEECALMSNKRAEKSFIHVLFLLELSINYESRLIASSLPLHCCGIHHAMRMITDSNNIFIFIITEIIIPFFSMEPSGFGASTPIATHYPLSPPFTAPFKQIFKLIKSSTNSKARQSKQSNSQAGCYGNFLRYHFS